MKTLNSLEITNVSAGQQIEGNMYMAMGAHSLTLPQSIAFVTELGLLDGVEQLNNLQSAFTAAGLDPNKINLYVTFAYEANISG